jgi:predicted nuclease with TOPRIM domain
MEDTDTVTPVTETAVVQPLGTTSEVAAPAADAQALSAQTDALRKDLQKLEMERNQLRNKLEEDERKRLEETNNYKELWEKDQKKLADYEAEKETDSVMSQYSPETQKLAKKLFATGDLKSQLDALDVIVKGKAEEPAAQPRVEPLNPNTTATQPSAQAVSPMQEIRDLEAKLDGHVFA